VPRTPKQWEAIRNASREHILRTAFDLFKSKGLHETSMSLIARRARVSKGLSYNYFRSKHELVAAAVELWLEELEAIWSGAASEPDPLKALKQVVDRFCRSLERDPNQYRLYFAAFLEEGYLVPILAAGRRSQRLADRINRIRTASRDLFRRLGASNPETEVVFFRLLTTGLAAEYIMAPNEFPMRAVKARILSGYRSRAVRADRRSE
jgi:AcrR family transcriptional regulator